MSPLNPYPIIAVFAMMVTSCTLRPSLSSESAGKEYIEILWLPKDALSSLAIRSRNTTGRTSEGLSGSVDG